MNELSKNQHVIRSWVIINFFGLLFGYLFSWVAQILFLGFLPSGYQEFSRGPIEEIIRAVIRDFPIILTVTTAQWLFLKPWINNINLWVPASALGYSVSILFFIIVALLGGTDLASSIQLLFAAFIIGIAIGFSQWFILRKTLKESQFWLVFTPLAFLFSLMFFVYIGTFWEIIGWTLASVISGYLLEPQINPM